VHEHTLDDLEDVAAVLADPAVLWREREPFTRNRTRAWLEEEIVQVRRDGSGRYAVALGEDGAVIGGVAFVPRHVHARDELEPGYHLRRDQWGKGYATAAATALLADAARRRGVRRVVAFIHPGNDPFKAVAWGLGFRPEGELE
jgi:RimJ/RimL family protein N-acetyltransferase